MSGATPATGIRPKYVRIERVGEITTLAVGTLYNLHSRGEGPPACKVRGRLVFDESAVFEWIASQATVKSAS